MDFNRIIILHHPCINNIVLSKNPKWLRGTHTHTHIVLLLLLLLLRLVYWYICYTIGYMMDCLISLCGNIRKHQMPDLNACGWYTSTNNTSNSSCSLSCFGSWHIPAYIVLTLKWLCCSHDSKSSQVKTQHTAYTSILMHIGKLKAYGKFATNKRPRYDTTYCWLFHGAYQAQILFG